MLFLGSFLSWVGLQFSVVASFLAIPPTTLGLVGFLMPLEGFFSFPWFWMFVRFLCLVLPSLPVFCPPWLSGFLPPNPLVIKPSSEVRDCGQLRLCNFSFSLVFTPRVAWGKTATSENYSEILGSNPAGVESGRVAVHYREMGRLTDR